MTTQAKLYMLITNDRGEMCVFLTPPENYPLEPDRPEIIYDGGENAILYRAPGDAVILDSVAVSERGKLAALSGVLVIEYDTRGKFICREYVAPVARVEKLPDIEDRLETGDDLLIRIGKYVAALFLCLIPLGAMADRRCVEREYGRRKWECGRKAFNIVDIGNCITDAIAEKCEMEPAEVFKILEDRLLGDG